MTILPFIYPCFYLGLPCLPKYLFKGLIIILPFIYPCFYMGLPCLPKYLFKGLIATSQLVVAAARQQRGLVAVTIRGSVLFICFMKA